MVTKERYIAKETYAVPLVPVYPFIVEEWLWDEDERKGFLDAAFDNDSDIERAKEDVRESREYHGDPVPDPEFFGY